MKKFLVMLMVVAMASFLFTGCLPTAPEVPEVPEEEVPEEEVPVVTTVAPIITSITDNPVAPAVPAAVISLTATTVYMNKAEVALGIIVNGTAPTLSEVKVYIDDICAGTADVGASGTFSVVVAKADLGSDGEKTLYAIAKEAAIAVSAKSVEYTFTLDTDLPGIKEVKATAFAPATGGTATTGLVNTLTTDGVATDVATTPADVVAGTWHLLALSGTDVQVTDPDGVVTHLAGLVGSESYPETLIPGVTITLVAAIAAAQYVDIVCVAEVDAIIDRATVEFDEDVTIASAAAGTYAFFAAGLAVTAVTVELYDANIIYWSTFTLALAPGNSLVAVVSDVDDLAGNTITALSSGTCFVGMASETALEP